MNKKIIVFLVLLVLFLSPSISHAKYVNKRDVKRVTFFNRITDSLATIGMTQKEKDRVIRKRVSVRRKARLLKKMKKNK